MEDEQDIIIESGNDIGETQETENGPVIYTGPNVFAMGLHRFRVFRNGLPPEVRRAIEKIPDIASLIVPVSELENTRQKINKPGTNEARLFDTVQKEAEKFSGEFVKSHRKAGK